MEALVFSEGDRELLVDVVKASQSLKLKGRLGGWMDFVTIFDRSSSTTDPAKRPWQTLAAFVRTFTIQDMETIAHTVGRMKNWKEWCKEFQNAEAQDPWPDTSEQRLVKLTVEDPRFKMRYKFPSYHQDWKLVSRGCSADATDPEMMLSIDCEMVKCENEEEEIVQVCVVDRDCKTLMDTLVRPSKRVVDYLTSIHGITQEQMEKATCTQKMAQAMVNGLIKPGTILVGHSLNHDLKVLKIDYRRVIDTALIFKRKEDSMSFRLTELCKTILGYDFREENVPHKCIDDAMIPMKLVLHELQNGPSELLNVQVSDDSRDRLFIHRIPPGLTVKDLKRLFPSDIPCVIEEIQRKKPKAGTSFAVFSSKDCAEKAFSLVTGELGQDSFARQQKTVTVARASSSHRTQLFIRKMLPGDAVAPATTPSAFTATPASTTPTTPSASTGFEDKGEAGAISPAVLDGLQFHVGWH